MVDPSFVFVNFSPRNRWGHKPDFTAAARVLISLVMNVFSLCSRNFNDVQTGTDPKHSHLCAQQHGITLSLLFGSLCLTGEDGFISFSCMF